MWKTLKESLRSARLLRKNPGDVKRLAVSQTPVKGDKLKKTCLIHTYIYTYINNGFPKYIADTEIKHFINYTLKHKQSINLYNKNQFHSNYKIDEHILKNLI